MEKLDRYLQENFDVPAKNPSEEAQRRWRQAVGTIVKNRRRRFRWVPDLDRRSLDKAPKISWEITFTISPRFFSFTGLTVK
uniref:Calcium-transporting P-type ATPase N-terminal autoinhibitory domain-containing protein n=1 Tax=Oryza meridionalis TaxID=40149 RepID=A0A0E0F9C1_9ORYZ